MLNPKETANAALKELHCLNQNLLSYARIQTLKEMHRLDMITLDEYKDTLYHEAKTFIKNPISIKKGEDYEIDDRK